MQENIINIYIDKGHKRTSIDVLSFRMDENAFLLGVPDMNFEYILRHQRPSITKTKDYKIDLRDWQDDKTVLKNPHKGWYWHYIDNGYGRGAYRDRYEKIVYKEDGDYDLVINDFLEDFPLLNHLYLRFDWGDIEKKEGVYDWTYIDKIMDVWGKKGYMFSLRICTFEGTHEGVLKYATPKWVFDKGAKFTEINGRIEPDYGDEIYLEYLSRFMQECGRKFNNDPLIEFVDVGTFGTWGEGHTCEGSGKVFSFDTMIKHIDLHVDIFPINLFFLTMTMSARGRTQSRREPGNY